MENIREKLKAGVELRLANIKDHAARNSFSWVFGIIIPLLVFGTSDNLKLLAWKITVVCAGCVVFHIVRKQMFPYIDPGYLIGKLAEEGESADDQFLRTIVFLGQCILLGLLGYAIIASVAGGL